MEGIKDSLPIMLVVGIFGMLYGATSVSSGLPLEKAVLSSALILAGASQFVFLDLYGQKVPVWSILIAVFAINFRHILYSASLGRRMELFSGTKKAFAFFFLSDPVFGAGEARADRQKLRPSYYFGYAVPQYCTWVTSTLIGGLFGKLITDPEALGMDMLLSIYFLSLLMGFRSRPNWLTTVLASGIASVLIYQYIGSPWHITLGAAVGILLAAAIGKSDASRNEGETNV